MPLAFTSALPVEHVEVPPDIVIAGGKVAPDATTFTLKATHGSTTYGILSNPYLEEVTYTPSFEVTFTVGPDTLTYDETTTIFTRPSDKRTEDYVTGRFG